MTNSQVNFVYLEGQIPMFREFWIKTPGFDFDGWMRRNQSYANERNQIFYNQFLTSFIKGQYYFFITTPEQEYKFNVLLDNYGLRKFVIWQSREPAVNINSVSEGPRLTATMLFINEEYNYVQA